MMGGTGYYRGSSVLISGTAGTGKSTLAASFATSVCRREERCLYFAFEESENQIVRNMRSVGIDLQPPIDAGLLRVVAQRGTLRGLEAHLLAVHDEVRTFEPAAVVIDPVSNLLTAAEPQEVKSMLTRVIDFLKVRGVTSLFTSLTTAEEALQSAVGVSSLMDTWILLTDLTLFGERNRGLQILKSRGMAHSSQIREFLLTDEGVRLVDVYPGAGQILAGSARVSQEAKDAMERELREEEVSSRERESECRRTLLEARLEAVRAEYEAEQEALARQIAREQTVQRLTERGRKILNEQRRINLTATDEDA